MGGFTQDHEQPRAFFLRPGITVIGSGPEADLILDGLDECHAEVHRNTVDEYIFMRRGRSVSRVDGRLSGHAILRTGNRINLGRWTLSYFREEFADHGRPHGGRVGGTHGYQKPQLTPRPRSQEPGSGCEQSETDCGQYF